MSHIENFFTQNFSLKERHPLTYLENISMTLTYKSYLFFLAY